MLDLARSQDRFDLQPVKLSGQGSQSGCFLNHHGLHGREGTSRRAGASTKIKGEILHEPQASR
jgi:hypothetical protein